MKVKTLTRNLNLFPNACYNANDRDIDYLFYTSIDEISEIWDGQAKSSIFLQSRYLKVLENYPPHDYRFIYCLITKSKELLGIVYYQIRPLELDKNFQKHEHGFTFFQRMRQFFLSFIRHNLLINGNVLLTGPYGSSFNEKISQTDCVDHLKKSNSLLIKKFNEKSDLKIKTSLLKDFYDDGVVDMGAGYTKFMVQPSMHLLLPDHWKVFEDYLDDIKSKYKVRYKRALKKSKSLVFRQMTHDEVIDNNEKMYSLFQQTAQKAEFNLFKLHPLYFEKLHEFLEKDMFTYGVFEDSELIAFYTLIKNDKVAEAHFLGYDLGKNRKYQLYQNMLYRMIESSLDMNVTELNLSRTALEIKSSIGAEPKNLSLITRYEGSLINKTIPFFLNIIIPKKEWEPRNPFKEIN